MNKIDNWIIAIISLMILGSVCFFLGALVGRVHLLNQERQESLERTAWLLGVYVNSWDVLDDYIQCDVLKNGESIDEIESKLQKIAYFKFSNDDVFKERVVKYIDIYADQNLSTIHLQFDESYKLTNKYIASGLDGLYPISCPP